MIKNISIIVLLVLTILSGTFAVYQKGEAIKNREFAIKAEQEAKDIQYQVMQQRLKNEIQEKRVDSLRSELKKLNASQIRR